MVYLVKSAAVYNYNPQHLRAASYLWSWHDFHFGDPKLWQMNHLKVQELRGTKEGLGY